MHETIPTNYNSATVLFKGGVLFVLTNINTNSGNIGGQYPQLVLYKLVDGTLKVEKLFNLKNGLNTGALTRSGEDGYVTILYSNPNPRDGVVTMGYGPQVRIPVLDGSEPVDQENQYIVYTPTVIG